MADMSNGVPNQHASNLASYWLQNLETASPVDRRLLMMNEIYFKTEQPDQFAEEKLSMQEQEARMRSEKVNASAVVDQKNTKIERLRTIQSKTFLARLFWFIH